MKTAILTVGTEILFGQIVNTNAAFLSQQLNNLGYDVMYHYTVGDNPGRLAELIHLAFRDCDLILTTGGLGPTQDDLTKETIAKAMGDVVVENPACMKKTSAAPTRTQIVFTEEYIVTLPFPIFFFPIMYRKNFCNTGKNRQNLSSISITKKRRREEILFRAFTKSKLVYVKQGISVSCD